MEQVVSTVFAPSTRPVQSASQTQPERGEITNQRVDSATAKWSDGTARAPSRLAGLFLRLRAQESAALNASVAMKADEQGLHIAARLHEPTPERRGRLRDRIAALLSRHGLVGHSITVSGDAGPSLSPRDGAK
jgi:hypothetical protein